MTPFLLYTLTSIGLFAVCLFALVVYGHLLRKILALNIMGSAVFLFLAAVAARNADPFPDPVPHAMVLTGIVVAVSVTAFALAVARQLHLRTGRARLPEDASE